LDRYILPVKMSAYPPNKTLTSLPVSQEIALKFLTSYLSATKTTPHLHPNARLEPSGVTAGSGSSVIIHNLERVQAGLRGEWLAPVLELDTDGTVPGEEVKVAGGLDAETGQEGDKMQTEGWQDLDEYQREQSVEEGEMGERQAGVAQEGDSEFEARVEDEDEGEDEDGEEAPKKKKVKTQHEGAVNGASLGKPISKEDRKKAKKLKLKEEKKKRNEANASAE
jgi:hypothetical protein